MPGSTTSKSPPAAFIEGLLSLPRAGRILFGTPGLKSVATAPILVNSILWIVLFGFLGWFLFSWEVPNVTWDFWGPTGQWLSTGVNGLGEGAKLLLLPVGLVICWFSFTTIGFVIASPFNDILSERVEKTLCHPRVAANSGLIEGTQLTVLSMVDSLRLVGRQIFWTIPCLLALPIALVGSVPLFIVTARFTGLSCLDTAMSRNNLRDRHKGVGWTALHWQLLGLGMAMEMLFLIPGIGMLVMPLGVVAATQMYCSLDWDQLMQQQGLEIPKGFEAPRSKAL